MKHQNDIIDWNLAVERAGGKESLAKELMEMLVSSLPEHQTELISTFTQSNYTALHSAAHKLHSATCYCGTPRLKVAAKALEDESTSNDDEIIKASYQKLLDEIAAVLKAAKEL